MQGEDSNEDDSQQKHVHEDAGNKDVMTDEDVMRSIESTIKQREKQRTFWDQELREMNYWLRL